VPRATLRRNSRGKRTQPKCWVLRGLPYHRSVGNLQRDLRSSGVLRNYVPTFRFETNCRYHLQGSRNWTSWPFKMRQICRPKTSVRNYRRTLHNTPEERRSLLQRTGSLRPPELFCIVVHFGDRHWALSGRCTLVSVVQYCLAR